MKAGPGNYVEAPDIHEEQATWIKIHLENPTPAHVDGEIFSESVCDLEYGIQPGKLKILLPGSE